MDIIPILCNLNAPFRLQKQMMQKMTEQHDLCPVPKKGKRRKENEMGSLIIPILCKLNAPYKIRKQMMQKMTEKHDLYPAPKKGKLADLLS